MRVVIFCHSLLSDWNHGNAHFLRGIVTELNARGQEVGVYEPENSWSLQNLLQEHGKAAVQGFRAAYPGLDSIRYNPRLLDVDAALQGVDLVLVHEWTEPKVVNQINAHRAAHDHYRLLFHDTHHRIVTKRASMRRFDLSHFDGVLAFGKVIRDRYLAEGRVARAWTWHEAADVRVFHPLGGGDAPEPDGDLVWIGNWGDEERTAELHEFLIEPVKALALKARVYGVRYPEEAREALRMAGIEYGGWLPNYEAPQVFARYRMTLHVPRRPYTERLPGIPTIRVFEALACGIPLICAPWEDAEGLFTPGKDYLVARNGEEMRRHMAALREDRELACSLAEHGLRTIRSRHTCAHRVDELMEICRELRVES